MPTDQLVRDVEASAADASRVLLLSRGLADASGLPAEEALAAIARAVRIFTGAGAVVILGTPERGGHAAVTAVDASVTTLVTDHDIAQLLDFASVGCASDVRRRFRTVRDVPLSSTTRMAGTLYLLDRGELSLPLHDHDGVVLAATVAAATLGRHLNDLDAQSVRRMGVERITRHVSLAAEIEDATGNGMSVAMGWLDALADGRVESDDRDRVVASAQSRLLDVREAVSRLVASTTQALAEMDPLRPVDLPEILRGVTASHPVTRGNGSPVVLARPALLRSFLVHAAPWLVSEIWIREDHARVEITDASRIDREPRALLLASGGSLRPDRTRMYVTWGLASPWPSIPAT